MIESEKQQARELLQQGTSQLENVNVTDQQQSLMIDYIELLAKWNKAFNLTSITQWRAMVVKHLLDSIVVNPWIEGKTILDVGTGAGIPGVPLAILNDDKQFTLLDSNGKKTRFITQAVNDLKIKNVQVVQARIERFKPEEKYEQIICRAYSSLEKFVEQTSSLLHAECELLAMKGQFPLEEINNLPAHICVKERHELNVPYLPEQRHLILLRPRKA